MSFDVSFNPPQFTEKYDAVKMNQFVEEIERLHAILVAEPAITDADLAEMANLYVGAALDSPVVTVASDGATITLSLEDSGGGDIRFFFTSGVMTLDTTPAATLALTAGTDSSPTLNYIYVLESTKVLTKSTAGWPSAEHAPIATVLCQTAADAQTDGLYKVHAWTDHTHNTEAGHLAHLNFWIREQPATWLSGAVAIVTAGASTFDLDISVGEVLQLHPHAWPVWDTSGADKVLVANSLTAYVHHDDLTTITATTDGTSLANKYYNLVIWGVVSEDTKDCHLMVNVPTDSYTVSADAQTDSEGTSVYDIPLEFRGTGFLIARLTMRLVGTTFTEVLNTDLRGLFPSVAAGGGGGGGGGVAALPDLTDVSAAADTQNFVLATPSGSTGDYSGRLLVAGDIPDLSGTYAVSAHNHSGVYEPADADIVKADVAESIAADWDWQDNKIIRALLEDYSIESATATVAANAVTLTYSTAQSYELDLEAATGNVTVTIDGGGPSGNLSEMIVKVKQDSTSDRTLTWAGGTFIWPGGTEVEPKTGSDAITIYYLNSWDGGSIWYINGVEYG